MSYNETLQKQINTCKEYSSHFHNVDTKDLKEKQQITKEMIIGLVSEANSLLDAINWKVNRLETNMISRSKIIEELVDLDKFNKSICSVWGITAEEFLKAFEDKQKVLEQRYWQEQALTHIEESSKIAVLDIDGVLCDLLSTQLNFINTALGSDVKVLKSEINNLDMVEFEYLKRGATQEQYRKYKRSFYESGLIQKSKPLDGAIDFTKKLKGEGYTIILLSSRPYKDHPRIFSDTIEWCKFNNIQFDAIVWEKDKDMAFLKFHPKLIEHIKFVVEDDPKHATRLAGIGLKVYIINRQYNTGMKGFDYINTFEEIRVL